MKSGAAEVTVFDGRYDSLVQQDQFGTMISQKFDAIIFAPIDADAGATAVKLAHDAKIPVVGTNTRANTDLLASYVGSDDVRSGYLEAKAVLDKLEAGRDATGGIAAGLDDLPLFAGQRIEAEQVHPLEEAMAALDPDSLTPREALDALYALKRLASDS